MSKRDYDPEKCATTPSIRDVNNQDILAKMGYKQEMSRNFNFLSMVGFTFSILSCWCALAASLSEVMQNGGPSVLIFGWIGCSILSFCVVIILAEMCSAYPVAGGQYSWCLLLSKATKWGRIVSYFCLWIQLSGIVGMCAVGSYQLGTQIIGVLAQNYTSLKADNWKIALVAYGSAVLSFLISLLGKAILHRISSVSLWWSISGFIVCTITILACAPRLKPAEFVFTTVTTQGWPNVGMAVVVGLMQTAYGMCSYDSVAHLAEETEDASKQSPRAMVLAVLIGSVTGLGFILALLFSIQDLNAVINTSTGLPILEIFYQATLSKPASSCLLVVIAVCQMFTNIALTTTASRSIYAAARDGAFPYHLNKWLMHVSPQLGVPAWAMLMALSVTCALIAILFGSSTAFFTVLSIASTGFYISYLIPIVVYAIRRKHKAPGYYNLGRWSIFFQIPAILYLSFCIFFFFFPTIIPVTAGNMNYNIVAFGIVVSVSLICWICGAKHSYIYEVTFLEGQEALDVIIDGTKLKG